MSLPASAQLPAAWLFWVSAVFVIYIYIGFPLILAVWARVVERRRRRGLNPTAAAFEPDVSIIIAARNEGPRIAARIANLLELDYPSEKCQVIAVSDGSTDDTLAELKRFRDHVEILAVSSRGKAAALNAGVARARNDVLVFADARQAFAPDALRELTRPFADPSIGGVTGQLLLDAESQLFANRRGCGDRRRAVRPTPDRRRGVGSTIADGLGLYWRYEKSMRRWESSIRSTLGATGAIYAIRRGLWRPLPVNTILDDVLTPMRIVLDGFRVVFNERARAFDLAAADADSEARRKIRTLAGNYQLIALEPRILLPWRNPVWFQYVSHKIGRLAVPYALLTIFATSVALSSESIYLLALLAQVAFYLLAGYGAWLELVARTTIVPLPSASPAEPAPATTPALTAREVA